MTTCEYDGTSLTYYCARYEQCDDCFMVDHLKVCKGCAAFEHKSLDVACECKPSAIEQAARAVYGFIPGEEDAEKLPVKHRKIAIEDQEYKWGEERVPNND